MYILIVGIQIILGVVFLMAGVMKLLMQDKARSMTPALRGYPRAFISFIGLAELLGAIGLTLPLWLGIMTFLTPLAALGLSVIMGGAIYTHLKLREYPNAGVALLFLVALLYIASTLS
ncbi:MAG: DoxX family protein [Patescibacteria group bacterium]